MNRLIRGLSVMALLSLLVAKPGYAQTNNAILACRFDPAPLGLNQQGTFIIEVSNVQNLYGYELKAAYEASRLQFQDTDTSKEGINLKLGEFLRPDFTVHNIVNSGTGGIQLVVAQLAPSEPKSGTGQLAQIPVQGIVSGIANISFSDVVFSNSNGIAIPITVQGCSVDIGNTGQPTPTATFTQAPTATPTATLVNTSASTATFTPIPPTATFTPLPATASSTPVPGVPTATWTPVPVETGQPTLTTVPTSSPTTTVVMIITPTTDPALAGGNGNQQGQLPSTLSTPTPMIVVNVSATSTPLAFTEGTGFPSGTPTLVAFDAVSNPSSLMGVEILSPPQVDVSKVSAPTDESVSISMLQSEPSISAERMNEPEFVVQPDVSRSIFPYQTGVWGWIALGVATISLAVAWQLRNRKSR